jgi:hypothetical protein
MIALPRSGTSWLQGMLGTLPEIATVRETHLSDDYLRLMLKCWRDERQRPDPDGLKAILSEVEFYDCLKVFCDRIFAKFVELNPQAEIILEKTPGNLNFVDLLNHLYPEAYFIHVIRDPRAVVASHLALKQEKWSWLTADTNHVDIALKWTKAIEKRDRAATLLNQRFLEVPYEDLKTDQTLVLFKITNFLGLNYTQQQLKNLIPQVSASDLDQNKANLPEHNPFFDNRPNFFRRGEVDSWQQELTKEQIIDIESVCLRPMLNHGYQPLHFKSLWD